MARQMYEECLHNDTIVYICDSLDLDITEVYEAYENIPSIKAKDDYLMNITQNLNDLNIDPQSDIGVREIIKAAFLYYIVCEGTFFYSGFAMLLSMADKIPGIAEQIQYTLRDESIHIKFGTEMLNKIREQNPHVWTKQLDSELTEYLIQAVELEIQYAHDVLPTGILGLNADMFTDYIHHIANRRLAGLHMYYRYDNTTNPFPLSLIHI